MRRLLIFLALALGVRLFAAEVIPPVPAQYFNDYAGVTAGNTAAQLNQTLENFEKETSSQIVVAVFPKMQTDSSIEDYTVRVARAWQVGQKDVNNGAVLFVFIQDRKMFIQVGYGLEGVLPDALCKRIIEDEIKPHFKAGDYNSGLKAGVQSLIEASRGEYRGSGRTVAQNKSSRVAAPSLIPTMLTVLIGGYILLKLLRRLSAGGGSWVFTSGGGRGWSSGSGGWSSSDGGWSGGGGGFSGGGGSFGGGGSGGSW